MAILHKRIQECISTSIISLAPLTGHSANGAEEKEEVQRLRLIESRVVQVPGTLNLWQDYSCPLLKFHICDRNVLGSKSAQVPKK